MKKLVIFLIPLIISIPAFTQDKSILTENFSLAMYSGDNICKVFETDISSERILLSIIDTVDNKNQKWETRYNLIYGQQEDINSEKKSESLAEGYLRRLAERNKKAREKRGTAGLVMGGASLVGGVVLMPSSEEEDIWAEMFCAMFIIEGAVLTLGSIYSLAVPSRAERELDDVLGISDPGQRERASHEALSSLAARGKKRRIILVAAVVAWAVSLSAIEKEAFEGAVYNGVLFSGLILLIKTPAERAYKKYLKEKKYRKELGLRVGIMPYGGVKIGLAFSF